jgi:tetratricopeptide (TPR) repeat protein
MSAPTPPLPPPPPPPPATLAALLATAALQLRAGRTRTAQQAVLVLVTQHPGDPHVAALQGAVELALGDGAASARTLEAVLARAPGLLGARVDLARALRALGRLEDARSAVRAVLATAPHHPRAWLAYGDVLVELGQHGDARVAFERARDCDPERATIERATAALLADDRRAAEEAFRGILRQDPAHVGALTGLAALSLAADRPQDAERLLRHALQQSAHVPLAWRGLGPALLALGRLPEAEAAAAYLCTIEPENPQSWIARAAVAARLLRQEDALLAYLEAVRLKPGEVRLHTSIGHVHKTLGRRAESEAAYKAALGLDPRHAEAWWSLADLKNYTFSDAEVDAMQHVLADPARTESGDAQIEFALGKAFEQREEYPRAFAHYARGNARRRRDAPFDSDAFEARATRIRAFFDGERLARYAREGSQSRAPIFIVGLPRSGSTLLEQILASHPLVEGTMELPNILNIARELDDRGPGRDAYPESLEALTGEARAALGERYLAETRPLRQGKPHFTDKLPNNFSHVGLIRSILPRAILIDARRHPLDCCFSVFKQHFAEGQTFSYDLADLGRYYRTYLALMDHWDRVLPGAVLHVQYEMLVRDPEPTIRRLLDHCGLPFDAACLAFHETRRSVRTASAEQVRQPLYTSGVGHWRHFEAELAPLREALGDALERFGDVH